MIKMRHPIIRVEKIGKTVGTQTVLLDVTFQIFPREFVCLKGPSGCGKTTMLRILAGLTAPDHGTIFIRGIPANTPRIVLPPHKRMMGFLFQNLSLWPHMTGREQLRFVWESTRTGDWDDRMETVCQEVGFPVSLLSKYPAQLSRGEQQRVAIARTVIHLPDILLLDEPFTALDQELRSRFSQFLKKLNHDYKITMIVVSHDLVAQMVRPDREIVYKDHTFRAA